jgi:integrase
VATIRKRVGAKGTRFEAIIRRRRDQTQSYRESQTFDTRADAERWAKHREDALNDPVAAVRAPPVGGPTLAALIRWYINSFSTLTPWGHTKQTALEHLERHSIGKINAPALNAAMLVDHIRARRAHGAAGSTAGNDLTWIGCVLRAAKDCSRCASVNPSVVDQARVTCNMLRLIKRPNRREIRPTPEQLDQLTEHFQRRDQRSEIPMTDIMWFAIHSSRREAEICRLRWIDNDPQYHTGLVRDAKHPFRKAGNHRRFKYTAEAWEIAARQPQTSDFIFPYKPQTISAAFTRACKVLGIADLTFHDLRHEAASRLFERGYTIPQVAQFTLHESWNELKRYTHLLQRNLRDLPDRAPIPACIYGEAIPDRMPGDRSAPLPNPATRASYGYHSQEGTSRRNCRLSGSDPDQNKGTDRLSRIQDVLEAPRSIELGETPGS